MCRQIANSKNVNSRRCQFEGQRNAVEPATNLQNSRHVGVSKSEAIRGRYRALGEQLDSRVTQRIGRGETNRDRWEFQCGQAMQCLALRSQRLAARGQNA